ncbi:MAG: zinc ribbon domain-containing protein [Syntrophobacteraceae bacterium]|nr:zinc ribbon domain-containing protein [Syntrophobacteraceae bacterium]
MPLYEYSCENCGYVFEELVLGGKEASACPRCGGPVHRMMSTFSYEMPDEVCGKLPKGEQREIFTECRQGGDSCPLAASSVHDGFRQRS